MKEKELLNYSEEGNESYGRVCFFKTVMKRVCKIAMEFAANEDIYNSMLESLRSGNEWENKIEKKEENKKTKFINGKFQTGEFLSL